ncbi:MAG: hypothetical protein ACOCWR_04700, partial [Oceanidesulfovibrio sp.]
MKQLTICMAVAAFFVFMATSATAENLMGEWQSTGEVWGAVSGTGSHGIEGSGDRHSKQDVIWTLKITSQENGGLHGEWCGPNNCEDLLGVVRKDGSIIMVDEDSHFMGAMMGEKLEVCVMEAGQEFRVAT